MSNEKEISSRPFSVAAKEKPNILGDINIQDWLKQKYNKGYVFGLDNLQKFGVYKYLGWEFDFRPYLKSYVYLTNGGWANAYAPNKTYLRKSVYGKIYEIYERIK